MSVTILHPADTRHPDHLDTTELVDELGRLNDQLKSYDELAKRREAIKRRLQSCLDREASPDAGGRITGRHYSLAFKPKAMQRRIISKDRLIDHLGLSRFKALAQVKLSDLDKYVHAADREKLVTAERAGSRGLDVEPITTNTLAVAAE